MDSPRADCGPVQRRAQSAPTMHRSAQIRQRRRPTISAGHVANRAACPDASRRAAAAAEYIIKQTARERARSLSANASGWITAPCDDVRPTASALIWRRQRRRRSAE